MLQDVALGDRSLADYTHLVGRGLIEEIRQLAEPLAGKRVLHVSATAFGGGVSEILYTVVPLMRDVGLDVHWRVILGREEFFNVTKLMHNSLQGDEQTISDQQWEVFEAYNAMNAQSLDDDWDAIIVHDPQPAALRANAPERSRIWIWRCHIDLSTPNPQTLERLLPLLREYDKTIWHLENYVPSGMDGSAGIIPPAIDPLSPKNMALSPEDASFVCKQFGIDVERPLICQVSRFDPWKDPIGVIDAFRLVREEQPEVQLALVGSMATDDPEGWEYFHETFSYADGDPDIKILNNLNNVGAIEVNAFQSQADVVMQKSLREGFGLTVTEALWKGRATVAGKVGGIPLQIVDGETGYLISSPEEAAQRILRHTRGPGARQAPRPRRQGARPRALPDPAAAARLAAPVRGARAVNQRLVIVSNRGPAEFDRDQDGGRTLRRGGGGLVTALSGLVAHRGALWIASAMTDEDLVVSREAGGEPVAVELDGVEYDVLLVESDSLAYDRFYNVIANPILWFIQHYLWDLSNAPDIRQEEADAWDHGYKVVNGDIARAVLGAIEADERPLVMLHDYHLYTCPGLIREARPDVLLHHFVHIPWSQPDSWRILPGRMREEIFRGLLANDIIGFHTTAYCRNFLHCCRELVELEVDYERGAILHSGRETWVRAYPLGIDAGRLERAAASQEVAEYEQELLRRRRDHLILRVDRADLSKNVLRGFTAFDTFLQQHPEFRERVTFIAHLQPSRTDVPEYAEYLDRIEALVAVVNHRHGTTDWMPIDLRIYENFPEAVARYKHFDLLVVNSLFDGMNLVAKEAPAVNTRDGVVLLSENTGAHEELGDCTLSVNPFDIQEQADQIHRALTMDPEERALRAQRLREIVRERDPGVWIGEQLADLQAKSETHAPA